MDLAKTAAQRPPLYRDAVVIKWVMQVVTLLAVVGALWFLVGQAQTSLDEKNIQTGFGFLSVNPNFQLAEGIDLKPDTGGRALWVGAVNTIRLAIAGIITATMLGILVGIARLSNNWMVQKVSSVYIEYMRNIPLLVHMLILFALIGGLGKFTEDQGPIHGVLHISQKGVSIPQLRIYDGFYQWSIFLIIGAVIGWFIKRQRDKYQADTGNPGHGAWAMVGTILVFAAIGWFANPIFAWVGPIFGAIESIISAIPQIVVQMLLAVLAIGAAGGWIKRFLDSRRTPAGLAKLSDDDYFRIVFAGLAGIFGAVFVLFLWPGLSSWIINSSSDLFGVLADKFGGDRVAQPLTLGMPDVEKAGNFANPGPGGLNFTPGTAAIYFALLFYTGAFIAEIVRGGILAVAKGQTEAAQALGLSRVTMLRKVILPQAFRVSLPPLGNQYLNLTKNTSLAMAVGSTDIVSVGTTLFNQTGRSVEVFMIWMLFYLACSLTISSVVNFFNVRLAIVER